MRSSRSNRIAVLLHLSNTHNWQDFVLALNQINEPFDLLINLVNGLNTAAELQQQSTLILGSFPHADIIISENRGMDIGGMFRLFERSLDKEYEALFYAHSKADLHWRRRMLMPLARHSEWAINTLCRLSRDSTQRATGMIGAFFYAYDYYNISPFMEIMDQLGVELSTTWEKYFTHFPASKSLSFAHRIAHAADRCNQNSEHIRLRPELDLEYARAFMGTLHSPKQAINPSLLSQMISERVVAQLPFYPGNFFWISMQVIRKLNQHMAFETEYQSLPLNLKSDQKYQSRAHAWERALPVFSMKNGLALKTLQNMVG